MKIEYILVAVLQGITEWLPISSQGQGMLFTLFFFDIDPNIAFSLMIWLHLGTMASALIKFRREFFFLILPKSAHDLRIRNYIIIATLATGIVALPLYFLIKSFFILIYGEITTIIIGILVITTGIILFKSNQKFGKKSAEDLSLRNFIVAGLAQGFAILPGISRSGVTISTFLWLKCNQEDALKYSFIMSVPIVILAVLTDFLFSGEPILMNFNPTVLLLMIGVSFFVGLVTIDFLLKIAKKLNFSLFCIFIGIIAIFGGMFILL